MSQESPVQTWYWARKTNRGRRFIFAKVEEEETHDNGEGFGCPDPRGSPSLLAHSGAKGEFFSHWGFLHSGCIRTQDSRFKVCGANHYTMGEPKDLA